MRYREAHGRLLRTGNTDETHTPKQRTMQSLQLVTVIQERKIVEKK